MGFNTNTNGRPRLACELTTDRVIAARASASRSGLDIYSTRRLPTDTVFPHLTGTNIRQPDALRAAVGGALDSIAGGLRDVMLIIPDAAVRVVLLDFDDLPTNTEEAAAVVRFRAKKSVPFDADSASLSFQADRSRRPVRVVAAFSPREVVEDYEGVLSDAGFDPGVVIPSIVGTLGIVEAEGPTMVVKIDGTTTTVSIVDGNNLILLRTLEMPGRTSMVAADIAGNVLPSIVFYEDTYSRKIERVLVAGDADLQALSSTLQSETSVRVETLAGGGYGGDALGDPVAPSLLVPVTGGLLGA